MTNERTAFKNMVSIT